MKRNLRRVINVTIGVLFLLLGVAGLVLPILNGLIFLIAGFIIISFESPTVEKKLFHITRKNGHIHAWHMKLDKWLRKIFT
jgi:uncharacterized membrane protein YbaN (DUF454 family)